MPGLPRMTLQTVAVVQVMLADPAGEHYGREIGQQAGYKPGTVQPILARLELAGVVESYFEDPAVAEAARRPRRRYYRFTTGGAERVRLAIAEAHRLRSNADVPALRPGYSGRLA